MTQRGWVAGIGVFVVVAYAVVMTTQALDLDPLAAVPGQSLGQIYSHLRHDDMDVTGDVVSVAVTALVGVGLAVATAVVGLCTRLPILLQTLVFLAVITLGAFATFGTGFDLGMDVADSYGVSGGDHTVWARALYGTSFAAFCCLIVCAAVAAIRVGAATPRAVGEGVRR